MRISRLLILMAVAFSLVFVFTKAQDAQSLEKPKQTDQQEILNQLRDTNGDKQLLEAVFQEGQTPDQVLQLLGSRKLTVEYLVYRSGEHTGWYVLDDNEPVQEAVKRFEQQHAQFLQSQLIDNAIQILPEGVIEGSLSRQQIQKSRTRLAQDFADQLSQLRNKGFVLSGFAVKGNQADLSALVDDLPTDKTKLRPVGETRTSPQRNHPKPRVNFAMVAGGIPYPGQPWKFSPTSGVISYDANTKYFTSSFIWTDVSGFNSTHSAYEHDITISKPKDTYVKPGSGAWYSNLPDAYLDTTLSDKEASFTIGSASATRIKANNGYYVQIPVKVINESAGPSHGVIQPQVGSWAGSYDEGDSPSEILEWQFCDTIGAASLLFRGFPAFCVFADQIHTIKQYNTGSSSAQFFPFDHRVSSSASWKAQAVAPTINPGSLSSQSPVKATISTTTAGATIRYTTNGAEPSSSSPVYTGPLTFTSSVTLKARAIKSGLSNSNVTTVTYSIVRTPSIEGADYMSFPGAGKQFIMRIRGTNFDPARTRVVVTGPGCSTFGACAVSNSVLRSSGAAFTSSLIERVPLTLSAGSYQLFVQNGSSLRDPVSKGTTVTVQPAVLANPAISDVKYLFTPVGGKQFTVRIDGRNFDTNSIRVVVTGPGCTKFGACVVSNKVLKDFSALSNARLPRVPLTLAAGKYQLFVQNAATGTSRASAGWTINVNVPPLELTRVRPQTTPKSGKQFISKIDGGGFDTSRIRVVVTGPGCPNFGMCAVPNNVIRSFGTVSANQLSKVPMKLGAGRYTVFVQNGSSFRDPVSNGYSLTVK